MDQTFPKDGLIHGGARHCCPHSVWHGARRKWMHIHDQRATQPRWMRAATRRASSASPERSDACLKSYSIPVAGGAVDQTFPKDGLIHGGARHCCPHSVWHGARRKWMHIHDQRATQPRWMRAATFEGLLQRAQSAAMLALSPIPFQVAGGAVEQTFPKDGLIHGGARHCCPHSVWHGARRKWMNIHDQRATKPRWMRAATRRASSASPERSDAALNPIPFQWRVEQWIRPSLTVSTRPVRYWVPP